MRSSIYNAFRVCQNSTPTSTGKSGCAARSKVMVDGRPAPSAEPRLTTEELLASFESFDVVAERAAISVLKLASWITTVGVVLYGLWKAL
jgi:hypothetical protein